MKREKKDYGSNLRFDEDYRDRVDTLTVYGLAFPFDAAKGLDGKLSVEVSSRNTRRPADPGATGETTDYDQITVALSLAYRW